MEAELSGAVTVTVRLASERWQHTMQGPAGKACPACVLCTSWRAALEFCTGCCNRSWSSGWPHRSGRRSSRRTPCARPRLRRRRPVAAAAAAGGRSCRSGEKTRDMLRILQFCPMSRRFSRTHREIVGLCRAEGLEPAAAVLAAGLLMAGECRIVHGKHGLPSNMVALITSGCGVQPRCSGSADRPCRRNRWRSPQPRTRSSRPQGCCRPLQGRFRAPRPFRTPFEPCLILGGRNAC